MRLTSAKSALSAPWDTVTVSAPRTLHAVRLVAHQCDGDAETAGFLQAEGHYGTGVRVHEQAHASSFFYREYTPVSTSVM